MRTGLILLLLIPQFLFGQKLNGVVFDKTFDEPLPGVTIRTNTGASTTSNLEGEFTIETNDQDITISFSFPGYEIQELEIKSLNSPLKIYLNENSNLLEDVVVSASKFEQKIGEVPVSMAIIKPTLIENKAIVRPQDIIDQIPGVQVMENQVSIRGGSGFSYGSGSRVLVLIDDMPYLTGDAGDVKWDALPLENLSQMEVLKGASSVLYGSSALNGIINIRTAYPTDQPLTKFNVTHGIYGQGFGDQIGTTADGLDSLLSRQGQTWWDGYQSYSNANFMHSRQIKNIDLVVGGNILEDGGYRFGENRHRQRINANLRQRSLKIDGLSYGVNTNYTHEEGDLFFLWQNADSVLHPQGGLDSNTTLSDYNVNRLNIDPYIIFMDTTGGKHSLHTRWFRNNNQNTRNQSSLSNVYFSRYQYQKKFDKDLTLTTGITNNYSTVFSEIYGTHTSNNLAVFLQGDKKIKKFNITGGFRLEHFQLDKQVVKTTTKLSEDSIPVKPVFRIGSSYELAKATFLRFSYGEGYRFPTIAEKFIKTSVGSLALFPNKNVSPETGWSSEIGIKQGYKIGGFKGFIDLAGFVTEYQDMMEFTFGFYHDEGNPWDTQTMGFPTLANYGAQSKNVEDARISGAEISITGTGKIKDVHINLMTGYTYINPISLNQDSVYLETFSDTSTMLKYRFKHLFKFDIELAWKGFSIGASNRYNSFMENVDYTFVSPLLGEIILPGYTDYRNARRTGDMITDLRLSYSVNDQHKVNFLINNLANREVSNRPGNILPPRTFIIQYNLKIQ